jgi:hypothetical protein
MTRKESHHQGILLLKQAIEIAQQAYDSFRLADTRSSTMIRTGPQIDVESLVVLMHEMSKSAITGGCGTCGRLIADCACAWSGEQAYDVPATSPEADVIAFNEVVPEGTMVRYWRGAREGEPSGTGRTRCPAQVLSGHTAVVWIEGFRGCVALSHVEVIR